MIVGMFIVLLRNVWRPAAAELLRDASPRAVNEDAAMKIAAIVFGLMLRHNSFSWRRSLLFSVSQTHYFAPLLLFGQKMQWNVSVSVLLGVLVCPESGML